MITGMTTLSTKYNVPLENFDSAPHKVLNKIQISNVPLDMILVHIEMTDSQSILQLFEQ